MTDEVNFPDPSEGRHLGITTAQYWFYVSGTIYEHSARGHNGFIVLHCDCLESWLDHGQGVIVQWVERGDEIHTNLLTWQFPGGSNSSPQQNEHNTTCERTHVHFPIS